MNINLLTTRLERSVYYRRIIELRRHTQSVLRGGMRRLEATKEIVGMGEMKLKLKPKTRKGKQLIRKCGEWWMVLDMGTPQCLGEEAGYLVKPEKIVPGESPRWIMIVGDSNFDIEKTHGTLLLNV